MDWTGLAILFVIILCVGFVVTRKGDANEATVEVPERKLTSTNKLITISAEMEQLLRDLDALKQRESNLSRQLLRLTESPYIGESTEASTAVGFGDGYKFNVSRDNAVALVRAEKNATTIAISNKLHELSFLIERDGKMGETIDEKMMKKAVTGEWK